MRRAPPAIGALFVASLLVAMALTGPLLLFNPWFVDALQDRHHVPVLVGLDDEAVDAATASYLADIWGGGSFGWSDGSGVALLDSRERGHMADVSRLVRLLALVAAAAWLGIGLGAVWLRREAGRAGRLLLLSAAIVGGVGLLAGLVFAVAFEPAFLAFHAVFFLPGTYLFGPDSDLIRLFPGAFWFEAALAAGASVVASALLAALLGWRLAREPAGRPADAPRRG